MIRGARQDPEETPELPVPPKHTRLDGSSVSAYGALPGTAYAIGRRAPIEMMRTSIFISRVVHNKLRAIAYEERESVNKLIMEGLALLFERKGQPAPHELEKEESERVNYLYDELHKIQIKMRQDHARTGQHDPKDMELNEALKREINAQK